jgi:hypothetical protein
MWDPPGKIVKTYFLKENSGISTDTKYTAYLHQVPAQPDRRKMTPAKLSDHMVSIVE